MKIIDREEQAILGEQQVCKAAIRQALALVTAALDRQAAVALIGPSQVGKTTLALTLGLVSNTTGSVEGKTCLRIKVAPGKR